MAAGATAPPCAAPFDAIGLEGHDDLQAPPASCECSCGALSSSCTATVTAGTNCGTGTTYNLSLNCAAIANPPGPLYIGSAISANTGSCPVNVLPQAPSTWGSTVRACGASAALPVGGCAGTARCAPPAPPGFAPEHCIAHDGDLACPADFPNKRTGYLGVNDTRACNGCSCTPPTCPTDVIVYSGPNCTGNGGIVPTTCVNAPGMQSGRIGGGAPRSCSVQGGTASGTVGPSSPFTLCCVP